MIKAFGWVLSKESEFPRNERLEIIESELSDLRRKNDILRSELEAEMKKVPSGGYPTEP